MRALLLILFALISFPVFATYWHRQCPKRLPAQDHDDDQPKLRARLPCGEPVPSGGSVKQ